VAPIGLLILQYNKIGLVILINLKLGDLKKRSKEMRIIMMVQGDLMTFQSEDMRRK